jgi:hypothetical protein
MVRLGDEIASAGTSKGLSNEIHDGDLNSV